MKRTLGWGLIAVFLMTLGLGAAACSHSHNGSDSSKTKDSGMSKKSEGSKTDKGDGY